MDSFSIQDTMNMGMGNQELLSGLYAPETQTAAPESITPITVEVKDSLEKPVTEVVDTTEIKTDNPLADFLEKETTTEETTEAPVTTTQDTTEIVTDNQFEALAGDLYKLGVFNNDDENPDEPITTPEQFKQKFEDEKKKGAQDIVSNFIGQFGEDYQNAFDAIFVKGVDPKEYFTTYNNIVNFSELDLTQESNQIKVIKQGLLNQGFEETEADEEIERLKGYGDLEQVSQRHHKVLIKSEAKKLQEIEENSQRELQQKTQVRNQYINNVQTILQDKLKEKAFDGIPLNPKLVTELSDFLLIDKWKTPSGETLSDFDKSILDLKKPENHSLKVKYALLLKLLEKDPTLSTIQKTGITTQTNVLFDNVTRQTAKKPIQTTSTSSPAWNALK